MTDQPINSQVMLHYGTGSSKLRSGKHESRSNLIVCLSVLIPSRFEIFLAVDRHKQACVTLDSTYVRPSRLPLFVLNRLSYLLSISAQIYATFYLTPWPPLALRSNPTTNSLQTLAGLKQLKVLNQTPATTVMLLLNGVLSLNQLCWDQQLGSTKR